ncbi:heme ABC transporter substrate-binding protein IsdE [Virgibacillus sp. YIM 98842]|uniref:heme ABC transporter substrate-binding protein IsdE n=1 Tax=Virgibacillus sp. YIM 98842 TaxID=2663533 RepID=UPI0013DBFBDC|nr:heme ABC transporter substrate-binding protein IsdE [Virgibacillus sp. YIM 98842]
MKNKIGIFLIITLLIILAGCGTDGETTAAEGQSSTNNNQTSAEKTETTEKENSEGAALETNARIVTTTVALTEIMDKLELDLVGVPTTQQELPDRYQDLPEVGIAMTPDMELIRSLNPTDVLTVTTLIPFVEETFDQTDTEATYINLETIEGMYEGIEYIGKRFDREEQAEELVNNFKEKLTEIEETAEGNESPKVLVLLGVPGSYLVATEESYVGDLVKRAGGENAIEETGVDYVSSNTENLQQSEPDIILRLAQGMPEDVLEMFEQEFAVNDIWQHFKAVQEDRVYDLDSSLFGTTADLAAAEALEELVGILYPDAE